MQERWSGSAAAFIGISFALIFCWQWIGGTPYTWGVGGVKGGDLRQHYVAGLMWNENRSEDLYRGFAFSRRLTQWQQTTPIQEQSRSKFASFNYAYSPFVARISALLVHWDFQTWIRSWLVIMLASTVGAWILLSGTVAGLLPRCAKDWFLLLSFPGLWYTMFPSQNSTVTLFSVASAGLLMTRSLPFAAGAVIACAFYKPHLVLCVGVVMLVARQYRFSLGLGAASLFWLAVQVQMCGLDLHIAWVRSLGMTMSGQQFQKAGLNQSWRGWFLSMPGLPRSLAGGIGLGISIVLLILAGLALQKLGRRASWQPGYHVLVAAAFCTVASPYTVYYDFMLTLGLWVICCRSLPNTNANIGICFLGWLASLFSVSGQLGFPWITAPLVTLWTVVAMSSLITFYVPPGLIEDAD